MRLEEKLQTIYRPHLPVMGNGSAETVENHKESTKKA